MAWALPYDQMGNGVEMPHITACVRFSVVGAGSSGVFQTILMQTGQQNAVIRYSVKLRKPLQSSQYLSNQKMNENGHAEGMGREK